MPAEWGTMAAESASNSRRSGKIVAELAPYGRIKGTMPAEWGTMAAESASFNGKTLKKRVN